MRGSTIGISLVRSADELEAALANARDFCDDVLIERYIAGRELTVGVLNGSALAMGEILLEPLQLFDYASKYQTGMVREVFPAQASPALLAEVKRLALAAHQTLELGSYSRVDIRLDAQSRPWVLEVNSLPGLTQNSLLPQSALAWEWHSRISAKRLSEQVFYSCVSPFRCSFNRARRCENFPRHCP